MIEKYINPHTESELKLYEDSVNAYRDIVNAIRTAEKKKFAEGRAEGRAEVIVEVAKKMLDNGMSADLVAEMTGLSLEEVSSLKQ